MDNSDDPDCLWCYCKQLDDGQRMIWCDCCKYWYHCDCLGLYDSQVDSLVEDNSDFVISVLILLHHMVTCLTIPLFPLPLSCGEILQDQCLWTRLMRHMMKLSIGVVIFSHSQLVLWAHSLCRNWPDCFSPLPWKDVL